MAASIRVRGGFAVGILTIVVLLLAALLVAGWSCARSYYESGRRRGLDVAARELIRGARPRFPAQSAVLPEPVRAALAQHRRILANPDPSSEPGLSDLGHAIGEACWRNGFDEAVALGATPDDKIRIEVSLGELLQMSWLAHLGFQHMMPNYRGIEVHRFSGPVDAGEAAHSVALLECALPKAARPFADVRTQIRDRDKLITDWWPAWPARDVA